MRPPLANKALCLSTPKHNGKSGTGRRGRDCMAVGFTASEISEIVRNINLTTWEVK
jgi:hypothetical protein